MRGFCLNITVNPESIPNYVCEILKYLCEIPARFFLNKQRCNEEPHIDQRNAFCQMLQRVPQRQSEILFHDCRAELPRDRCRCFIGDHPQTGRKRVSRSNPPIEQVQSFREMFLEKAQSATPLESHIGERGYAGHASKKYRKWKAHMEESGQNESKAGQDHTSQDDFAGAGSHPGL